MLNDPWRVRGAVGLTFALVVAGACAPDFNSLLPAGDGTGACSDSSDCPEAGACVDALCEDGFCLFQARQCDDGNPCTTGGCVVDTDECVFTVNTDMVGEECDPNKICTESGDCECVEGFQSCDGEPGCESHINSDPMNCGSCGNACTDHMACIGGQCDVCTSHADCDDGRVCTEGTCADTGACDQHVLGTYCLISGTCRTEGARSSSNPCHVCDPSHDQHAWTVSVGDSCDDGDFCTTNTTCNADGECVGDATCDDGRECTANQCQRDPNRCLNPIREGWCLIDGVCYRDGEPNPDNECQECNASNNPGGWSNVPDGQACGDDDADRDLRCTAGVCGGCRGDGDCNDGDVCTEGRCGEDGACEFVAIAGCCRDSQCWDPVLEACRSPQTGECIGPDGTCCTLTFTGCECELVM